MTAQMICSAGRADRRRVDADATLRAADWAPIDIEIEDISVTGFRMSAPTDLPLGELVSIGVAGLGMQPAFVVRRDGQTYGCRFVNTLSDEQVGRLGIAPDQVVAPLANNTAWAPEPMVVDKRLSPALRVAIIAAIAILSWSLLIGIALLIF